jgi:hypothetical protein
MKEKVAFSIFDLEDLGNKELSPEGSTLRPIGSNSPHCALALPILVGTYSSERDVTPIFVNLHHTILGLACLACDTTRRLPGATNICTQMTSSV